MQLLERVMLRLIAGLVEEQKLELEPGTSAEAVAAGVLARVRQAPHHAHVGEVISAALLDTPGVVELYVDDQDLVERLNHFYG